MMHAANHRILTVRCLLAVLTLGLLAACGGHTQSVKQADPAVYRGAGANERTDLVEYRDPDHSYVLHVPRDWYIGQLPGLQRGLVVASSNESSAPRAAITVLAEPMDTSASLAEAIAVAEETLRSQQGIASFGVDLARHATVNGNGGEERLYTYQLEQQPIRQRTFYLRGADQLYAVSLLAPQQLYPQYEALFGDVIASWNGGSS